MMMGMSADAEKNMNDPAVEAAQRAWPKGNGARKLVQNRPRLHMEDAARQALNPIRHAMIEIKDRYDQVHGWMIAAETSAEQSRHANELAGLMYAYNLIAPLVYTSEEMAE